VIRSGVGRNIVDPKKCHEKCLSEPKCIAWHLRSSDNVCVPVSHYTGVYPKPGWVSGRRNVCIGSFVRQILSMDEFLSFCKKLL
jgi:hypothetical protein